MSINNQISVIITINSNSENLDQYIQAICDNVSLLKLEIILIGKYGSDDQNINLVKKKFSRVKIIKQDQRGVAKARNCALCMATGKYVVFVNKEDRIAWDQLYIAYEQAQQADVDMLLTQVKYFHPDTEKNTDIKRPLIPNLLNKTSGKNAFITLMQDNNFSPLVNGILYKREWIECNGLIFEDSLCPDEYWSPKAFCLAEYVILSEIVFYYTQGRVEPEIHQVDTEGGRWVHAYFCAGDQAADFAEHFTSFSKNPELRSWLQVNVLRIYASACRILTAIRTHGTFELPQHKMHTFKTIDSKVIPEAAERCRIYYKMAVAWEQEYLLWKNNPCDPIIAVMPEKELECKRIILVYNSPGWQNYQDTLEQLPSNYILTLDRQYMDRAFAVVFHLPGLFEHIYDDLEKQEGQVWIRWNMEPDCNFLWMNQLDQLNIFDLKMDYHPQADIVCPYYAGFHPERVSRHIECDIRKNKICMLISSSVHQSGREEYLAELMKYTGVDSYGRLYKNCCMKEDKGWESKIALYSQYKFVIAFENSRQEDYVTEKLYDPLLAGAVPIYLGAPNVDDYLPREDCIIRADRFGSPKALAEYIEQCYANRDEYMKYHQWRTQPWRSDFLNKVALQDESPFVRLCHLLDARYPQGKHALSY